MNTNELRIGIASLAQDGRGVGRVDGRVCFVEGGLPGETVLARVVREKPSMLEAVTIAVESASPARCQPVCPETRCGGCALRAMEYQAQLAEKRRIVEEQLARIGKIPEPKVLPMVGMEDPFGYRNRVRLVWDGACLVFRARQSHESGGRIAFCRIASPEVVRLACAVEDCLREGLIRIDRECEVLVRFGVEGYVGFEGARPARVSAEAAGRLQDAGAAVLDVGGQRADLMRQDPDGEYLPDVEYRVGGMTFAVKGRSFFQTNIRMAERLFRDVLDILGSDSRGTVIDLYGGVGAPGLLCAREGRTVLSVEIDPDAVRAATFNATRAGVAYQAIGGDAARVLPGLLTRFPRADLVVDPPRAGLSGEVVAALVAHPPERIIMISCDPATLARDAGRLTADGTYVLEYLRPYDMFPWTHHSEALAVFVRRP
ncbi:MAG TPA: class I SAM-dependent RNA methyltransferase [Spirochaetota bacterium]|nr:class I SAM-dependent RNA methyltransferase [Spirochaetota bacterium]